MVLTDEELLNKGEEPKSYYGYFIIKGLERLIIMNENLRPRRIFNFLDQKRENVCRTTLKGSRGSVITELYTIRRTIRLFYTNFPDREHYINKANKDLMSKTLNILQPFRILKHDITLEEILHYIFIFIKPEWVKKIKYELESTIIEYKSIADDYKFVIDNFKDSITGLTFEEKKTKFKNTFEQEFLPHMEHMNTELKFYYFGYMVSKYISVKADFKLVDNRDSWTNKYVRSPGKAYDKLFNILISTEFDRQSKENNNLPENKRTIELIGRKFKPITTELIKAFQGGVWGIKGKGIVEENQTELIDRYSLVGFLSALYKDFYKINYSIYKSGNSKCWSVSLRLC